MRGAHKGVCCSKSTPLIEAGLFAATAFAPCTGWPRTVMRGKLRKLTSGHNSLPKPARRTEPSPRNPRFAAQPKGVAAKRRVWGSQEGEREPYGALSPLVSAAGRRHSHAMSWRISPARGGPDSPPPAAPLDRRRVCPLLRGRGKGFFRLHRLRRWIGGKVCLLLTRRFLRIYKAFYKGFS